MSGLFTAFAIKYGQAPALSKASVSFFTNLQSSLSGHVRDGEAPAGSFGYRVVSLIAIAQSPNIGTLLAIAFPCFPVHSSHA